MPVLCRCPMCQGVMPDAGCGEVRCRRCGDLVVPILRKLCAGCGGDVTRAKRVHDPANGEYYCHDCWEAKQAAQGEVVAYLCNTCGLAFASDQVYQDAGDEVICRDCYRRRAATDPAALLSAAQGLVDAPPGWPAETPAMFGQAGVPVDVPDSFEQYRRKASLPWGLISFGIAVFVVLVVTLVVVSAR